MIASKKQMIKSACELRKSIWIRSLLGQTERHTLSIPSCLALNAMGLTRGPTFRQKKLLRMSDKPFQNQIHSDSNQDAL